MNAKVTITGRKIVDDLKFSNGILMDNLATALKETRDRTPEDKRDAIYRALFALSEARRAFTTAMAEADKVFPIAA